MDNISDRRSRSPSPTGSRDFEFEPKFSRSPQTISPSGELSADHPAHIFNIAANGSPPPRNVNRLPISNQVHRAIENHYSKFDVVRSGSYLNATAIKDNMEMLEKIKRMQTLIDMEKERMVRTKRAPA